MRDFPTDYWNDSCAAAELAWAIEHGGTGATTNPTIVGDVLKREMDIWAPRIRAIHAERPDATDQEVTWQVIEEMAIRGWAMLQPVFEREGGRKGRLSIQTNPTYHGSTARMMAQARHFATLAANVQVKFPVTAAGLAAIEQATYEGIPINATVSFTVPQALAVGEAVERALRRREAEGKDVSLMSPVCTLMIGRLDDWVRTVCERDDIILDPAAANWAGLAVFKRAAAIYRERGYRCRLLVAAFRNHLHWSELIGGDVVLDHPIPVGAPFRCIHGRGPGPLRRPGAGGARRAAARSGAGLPARLRARWVVGRRVRHLRTDRAHAAGVHRQLLVPRGHGRPAAAARSGREAHQGLRPGPS